MDVVIDLDDNDLEKIGVNLGDRKRLLRAIAERVGRGAASVGEVASSQQQERSTAAERRQLTVLFCDLVGSTELSQQLDPEDLRDVMRRYQDAVAGSITRYEGFVAKFLGDGVLAYFGWPRAYEDQAERAVRAGLAAVQAVTNVRLEDGRALESRVGVATGEVVVGDLVGETASELEAVIGDTPNLAARLQGLARPGAVVISTTTHRLIANAFDLEDLGLHTLKGFAEAVAAWRVIGEGAAESRFAAAHPETLTRFVGREHELGLLLESWKRAKSGEGQVVVLSGEPGIGKSRIVQTLQERIAGEPHVPLRYQCSPHHINSAFYPVIRQLERAAEFERDDGQEAKLDKLEAMLAVPGIDVAAVAPLFAALLGLADRDRPSAPDLSPQRRKELTLAAICDHLLAIARNGPVLVVYEDIHWIDPTSKELLERTVEQIVDAPVLLLITHRPEARSDWRDQRRVMLLSLNRLDRRQASEMVHGVGGDNLSVEIAERIVDRADGVPLFVEELTHSLLEIGDLAKDADVPETLQALLTARLDRLDGAKELAQIGAVIGREFSHRLLELVVPLNGDDLQRAVVSLHQSGLVFRRGVGPDATYLFKHALVQDVAYDSLLRGPRRELHARIAEALETDFKDRVEMEPEVLAHHFTRAGVPERAAPLWLRAGQHARARSANAEAFVHFRQGLEILESLTPGPDRASLEVDMQIGLALASMAHRGYTAVETENGFLRASKLLSELPNDPRHAFVLHGLCALYGSQVKLDAFFEIAQELLERAVESSDRAAICVGHRCLAVGYNMRGEFASAYDSAATAIGYHDPEADRHSAQRFGQDIGVAALLHLALAARFLGRFEESAAAAEKARALADQLGHANTLAFAYGWLACMDVIARDMHAADQTTRHMVRIGGEHGLPTWAMIGRGFLGVAMTADNEIDKAVDLICSADAELTQEHNKIFHPIYACFEADGLAKLGRFDTALTRIDETLRFVETTQERWWEAELHRTKGVVMQQSCPATDEARRSFVRAIDVARAQQAKPFELRAATDLARLLQAEGQSQAARELIAPIYAWFTDGFDTADLKGAKALMAELS